MTLEYRRRTGEKPLTKFIDAENAAKVTLCSWPTDFLGNVPDLVQTCHVDHPDRKDEYTQTDIDQAIDAITNGTALWQTLEMLDFLFLFEGVTRYFTHQLVRARVGVTFTQQCSGEGDRRHVDVVVPRCFNRGLREDYIRICSGQKNAYASGMDLAIEDSQGTEREYRMFLPSGITNHIYMKCNLAMLMPWYHKRTCTMTQSWEMHLIAEQVKRELLSKCPWLRKAFFNQCESGRCFYTNAMKKDPNNILGRLFAPDDNHAMHMANAVKDNEFVYGQPDEQVAGLEVATVYYHGSEQVTADVYEHFKAKYNG